MDICLCMVPLHGWRRVKMFVDLKESICKKITYYRSLFCWHCLQKHRCVIKAFWVQRNMLLSSDWASLFFLIFLLLLFYEKKSIPALTNYLLKNNQDNLKYWSLPKAIQGCSVCLGFSHLVVILKKQNKFSLHCSKCTLINIVHCILYADFKLCSEICS